MQFLGVLVGEKDIDFTRSQAALLLSLLWMPTTLLPIASRLLLLPRALLSMASGSPPAQPTSASGSSYVAGSVSAAFVTCPNEKVAKEIARWGALRDREKGRRRVKWAGTAIPGTPPCSPPLLHGQPV